MGWEIDLAEGGSVLAVFIPNKCGNLSLLRKPAVHVARVVKVLPASVAYAAPAPAPAAMPTQAPMQVPLSNYAASTGPAAPHRFRARPLLLVPIITMFRSHGHAGPAGFAPAPIAPGSNPPPAGCPTPAPSH